MSTSDTATGPVWPGQSLVLLARLQNLAHADIDIASIGSLNIYVREVDGTEQLGANPLVLTVADVIFDTPVTDAMWLARFPQSTGYSFRYVLDGSVYIPEPKEYLIELAISHTGGGTSVAMFRPDARPTARLFL